MYILVLKKSLYQLSMQVNFLNGIKTLVFEKIVLMHDENIIYTLIVYLKPPKNQNSNNSIHSV